MRAQFVFGEVWIGLRRNLTMTVALIVVVAISLSLLGTGLLFVKQVNHTRALWQSKVELSIYLCDNNPLSPQCTKNGPATPAQTRRSARRCSKLPQVVEVTLPDARRPTSGSSGRNSPTTRCSSTRCCPATSPPRSRSS